MSSNSDTKSSIRLSQLNPQLKDRLTKFDTGNDGELSIEEALQGLVTLQKQSNNYKKMLYLIIPIIILTLGSMLGVNILAINLTKDLQSQQSSITSNPVLVDRNNKAIQVEVVDNNYDFISFLSVASIDDLNKLNQIQFNSQIDTLNLAITSLYLENLQNDTTTIIISTPYVWFSLTSDGNYNINYNSWISSNDSFNQKIYHIVSEGLNRMSTSLIQSKLVNNNLDKIMIKQKDDKKVKITIQKDFHPTTRGIGGFGCGKRACYG